MKPFATVSLDLDNKWTYMKIHGDAGWDQFPSYLDLCVPRILEFLRKQNLKITFFLVAQDLVFEKNLQSILQIVSDGHEIGNHSFNHEPWLHLYPESQLIDEISKAHETITSITGKTPKGFRGPGYSLSPSVIKTLINFGYEYDCSTLPTFIAPLARLFYFLNSPKMSDEERRKRKRLFGKFSDGFQPLKPYFWETNEKKLLEIPVTTFPLIKIPIHMSYLLYLASFSEKLAVGYLKCAIKAYHTFKINPSLLLHPLDFLSGDDVSELRFFPSMKMPYASKKRAFERLMNIFISSFRIVNLATYAESLKNKKLPIRTVE